MREYQCPLCRDTGIQEEPRQLFLTGTPGTFCSCNIGEEKWKEVVQCMPVLRGEEVPR